jgi:hypothetical protein
MRPEVLESWFTALVIVAVLVCVFLWAALNAIEDALRDLVAELRTQNQRRATD